MKLLIKIKTLRESFRGWAAAGVLVLAAAVSGCGSEPTGQVVIGLTDAEGDFLSYTVDVKSLTLEKANGAVVETMPLTTRVDFTQYQEMTEFLTVATVPTGYYTHATMKLDYNNADIQVEVGGVATAAIAQDTDGTALGELTVTVKLAEGRGLFIAPGIPAHLTVDFDLKASNDVDTAVTPPVVTVEPFIIADIDPQAPKIHRVRGPLKTVNVDESWFKVFIHPFHMQRGDFGSLKVVTDSATVYEIDQQSYTGSAGLDELATKPAGTATIVIGDLNIQTRQFEASEVYAGSSVPGGTLDVVTGNVTARSGDDLTVRGATLIRADGTVIFHDDVTVHLGPDTKVTRQAVPVSGLTKDDISVGQRVRIFGTLTGTDPMEMDATGSDHLARMLVTTLSGTVVSTGSSQLVIDLQAIDWRPFGLFNFVGTGTTGNDAQPSNYEIYTATINLDSLAASDPVKVRGFVRPWGQAPDDFEALTVIDVSAIQALLAVSWQDDGTTAPFVSQSSAELVVDLTGTNLGDLHHVFRAGVATDLTGTTPTVEPDNGILGLYAIGSNGTIVLYTDFAIFEAALAAKLNGTNTMKGMLAKGLYEDASTTFTAGRISAKIIEPSS